MTKKRIIIYLTALALLLWGGSAEAKKYAVLISAGEATEDDEEENSEFWYDLFLMYNSLIDEGYHHDDIEVLYAQGEDFYSVNHPEYRNPYPNPITDMNNHRLSIWYIFNWLGNVMTEEDHLFVWWMGHAGYDSHGIFWLGITNWGDSSWISRAEFTLYANQVQNYRKRIFSFMTCYSGAMIDNLASNNMNMRDDALSELGNIQLADNRNKLLESVLSENPDTAKYAIMLLSKINDSEVF